MLVKTGQLMIMKRFITKIKRLFKRYQIVDRYKYDLIYKKDWGLYFVMSKKEREEADKIYKEKGNITYEFCPTGIGYGLNIHVVKTGEVIDITDYDTW